MNRLVSALIGEMTTTGSMGTATTSPMRVRLQRRPIGTRDKDKDKDKKKPVTEDDDKEQSIIPPDANEIEGGDEKPEDQFPQQFGVLSDEQLEKLAGIIASKLAPMMQPKSEPKTPAAPAAPAKADGEPHTPDPVANWLIGQKQKRLSAPQESAPEGSIAAVLEALSNAPSVPSSAGGQALLSQGQPMPAPTPGSGKAFSAYCKFVKQL